MALPTDLTSWTSSARKMPNRFATRGFQALAIAAFCFVGAAAAYRMDLATIVGFGLMAAGFLLAASARAPNAFHWGRVGLAFLIVYVGMMPFFFEAFFPLAGFDWYLAAVLLYLVGLLATAAGSFLVLRFGLDVTSRTLTLGGALLLVLAGLLWLPLDILGASYWWTPGNLATFVGGLFLFLGFIRMDPSATAEPGPSKA